MARANASVAPPAGNGTIRRIGLPEWADCAHAGVVEAATAAAINFRRVIMFFLHNDCLTISQAAQIALIS
jgi:hypothetical protein